MEQFRILDFFNPSHLIYWRWILWKSQYYPDENLQAFQWKILSRLLKHCSENVPYYRKLFAKLGLHRTDFASLKDLSYIPILNKGILLDYYEEFKADNFERFKPREVCTTGTTGTPMRVFWDINVNVIELICKWRHFSWTGYRLGEPFLDIRNYSVHLISNYRWNWKCQGLEMSSQYIDESNIEQYAAILRKYRIKLWHGHPTAINYLCHLLDNAGFDDIKPKYVVTVGEALLKHQQKFIESWAGIKVCDCYGLMEHNAFICKCPQGGYHIASEYGIVEIIKDDGTTAQPGEEGRIVATGIHNKAFPLLRYDTGDYAVQSNRKCSCGRTLPLVEQLTGRIDDRILDSRGRWVSGLHITLDVAPGIRCSQIIQEQLGSLDIYIVPAREYNDKLEPFLITELKKEIGETMKIRIHRVRDVPFRKPGKFKFVVCKLKDFQCKAKG